MTLNTDTTATASAAAATPSSGSRPSHVPIRNARKQLGEVSARTIYNHYKHRRLTLVRLVGRTLVTQESIDALLASAPPVSKDAAPLKKRRRRHTPPQA